MTILSAVVDCVILCESILKIFEKRRECVEIVGERGENGVGGDYCPMVVNVFSLCVEFVAVSRYRRRDAEFGKVGIIRGERGER